MTADDYTAVRAGSLLLVTHLTVLLCAWRRPDGRMLGAATLAAFWNLPVLLALNLAAPVAGWWWFEADGGRWLGIPVDLLLAWIWLWGVLPVLLGPRVPLGIVTALALVIDLVLMPLAVPVVRLGDRWIVGEVVGLCVGFLPGQLLARWTLGRAYLEQRAVLQMLAVAGLLLLVLPAVAIDGSGGQWINPLDRPVWQVGLFAQLVALPTVIGLSAVQEFVTRGGGTPVPFDPPVRLVTSGLYAYVRSPMQLSALLILLVLAAALGNVWVAAAAVIAHAYSAGLAGWDEDVDLRTRFGAAWRTYRAAVPAWIPRWRPYVAADAVPSRLYVSQDCGMCRETGEWFERRGPAMLRVLAAEDHPAALTRMTYEPGDGSAPAHGILAVGRALEHLHLGWALAGAAMRLPVVSECLQWLADVSGARPRRISRRPACDADPVTGVRRG